MDAAHSLTRYDAFTATARVDELLATVQSLSQEQESPASTGSESKCPCATKILSSSALTMSGSE
jgi:hypothetical protein